MATLHSLIALIQRADATNRLSDIQNRDLLSILSDLQHASSTSDGREQSRLLKAIQLKIELLLEQCRQTSAIDVDAQVAALLDAQVAALLDAQLQQLTTEHQLTIQDLINTQQAELAKQQSEQTTSLKECVPKGMQHESVQDLQKKLEAAQMQLKQMEMMTNKPQHETHEKPPE